MSNCLYCYKELLPEEIDFHKSCCRKFFGTTTAPLLDYTREQMDELAAQVIQSQTTLTGVQPKLSLNLNKHKDSELIEHLNSQTSINGYLRQLIENDMKKGTD